VIPGFSQASFEVDEDSGSLELCIDVSSVSLERSVVLSLFTVEATAQGTATAAFVVIATASFRNYHNIPFYSLRTVPGF
jgi:hypothetical protein